MFKGLVLTSLYKPSRNKIHFNHPERLRTEPLHFSHSKRSFSPTTSEFTILVFPFFFATVVTRERQQKQQHQLSTMVRNRRECALCSARVQEEKKNEQNSRVFSVQSIYLHWICHVLVVSHLLISHNWECPKPNVEWHASFFLHIRLFSYIYVSCVECNAKEIRNFITVEIGANVFFPGRKGFFFVHFFLFAIRCGIFVMQVNHKYKINSVALPFIAQSHWTKWRVLRLSHPDQCTANQYNKWVTNEILLLFFFATKWQQHCKSIQLVASHRTIY